MMMLRTLQPMPAITVGRARVGVAARAVDFGLAIMIVPVALVAFILSAVGNRAGFWR